jgi:1-acyl-sn-glycerol-3-phosphate acyltransferase
MVTGRTENIHRLAASIENELVTFPVPESNKSRFAAKLRYWWSWLAAGSLLLLVGLPAMLAAWVVNRKESLYPLALWGAETWLAACGATVKVTGLERLDPEQSYVFASNHRSYLDTAALFRYTGRRVGLVAKKELLKVPVMGQGMGFVNIIAIDRTDPDRALRSMAKARSVLERGYSFGVFVEGTRAMPGQLLPFKKGAFHLALQTGVPIVPVAIRNTDSMMGKKDSLAFAGTIEMVLLPPISTRGKSDQDIMSLLLETRAAIIAELKREA